MCTPYREQLRRPAQATARQHVAKSAIHPLHLERSAASCSVSYVFEYLSGRRLRHLKSCHELF